MFIPTIAHQLVFGHRQKSQGKPATQSAASQVEGRFWIRVKSRHSFQLLLVLQLFDQHR